MLRKTTLELSPSDLMIDPQDFIAPTQGTLIHCYETLRITAICEESILPWEVCKYAYLITKLLDVNFDLTGDATVIG